MGLLDSIFRKKDHKSTDVGVPVYFDTEVDYSDFAHPTSYCVEGDKLITKTGSGDVAIGTTVAYSVSGEDVYFELNPKDIEDAKEKAKEELVEYCGKSNCYQFVMAYVFTKHGTKKFAGSVDLIKNRFIDKDICHGILHFYKDHKVIGKRWTLFGELSKYNYMNRYFLNLKYIRSGNKPDNKELSELIGTPKQSRYYLTISDKKTRELDLIASWRKLPSVATI